MPLPGVHFYGDPRVRPPRVGHGQKVTPGVQPGVEQGWREPCRPDKDARIPLRRGPDPVRDLGQRPAQPGGLANRRVREFLEEQTTHNNRQKSLS
jgi:hypothetical protein